MSENSSNKKTEALANPLQALVNKGVDALFKAAKLPQPSHVGMSLRAYALEGKDSQEPLKDFNQWEGAQGSKLSQAALKVLFLFKDKYKVDDFLRKNNNATAAEEIIAHITATFFEAYGKAQNSSAAIRAAKKAAQLGKQQTTRQQTTEKENLFKNISLN